METATKHTYAAVSRDCNSWDPSTGESHITWTCGHKHKTRTAAERCLMTMGNAGCAYHARIERSDGSLWDGSGFRIDD